jgi:polyisoprenoid-binding protein YceI
MRHIAVTTLSMVAMLAACRAEAVRYKVDDDHTSVIFQVRHLFTKVNGRFDKFDGTIDFDPAHPEQAKVAGTIDAATINTNNAERDKHLRSDAFFDVAKFPKITFASGAVTDLDAGKQSGKMRGTLTIHGVERPVVLDVAFLGAGKDPYGNQRAGFSARTTVDRKDFGLTWNEALETGGVLVGDEVAIELSIEGIVPQ